MNKDAKPEFGGLPYNPEPASDPLHEWRFDFESCGQLFQITLGVPLYIWKKLKEADWGQVSKWVRERANEIRANEALRGNLLNWTEAVEAFARQCIYNQFSKAQVAAGNDAWAVPEKF